MKIKSALPAALAVLRLAFPTPANTADAANGAAARARRTLPSPARTAVIRKAGAGVIDRVFVAAK